MADFWFWWTGVLRALFSQYAPWPNRPKSGFTLTISAATATLVSVERKGKSIESQPFPLAELGYRLAALRRTDGARSDSGIIRLGAGRFVLRRLSSLALPASRLQSAAALDLIASTPFKADTTMALPVSGAGRASSYAIVKTALLEPALRAFRDNRASIAGIEFETNGGTIRLAPDALHLLGNSAAGRKCRLALTLASALSITVGATAVHAYLRNKAAISQLSANVDMLESGAKQARKALNQRAAALAELKALRKTIEDAEPVSLVWEELAKVLPDTDYLTDLSVKSGHVTIAGYSEAAAALVVALEQSPQFSKVGFTAPVIRTPGIDGERFEMSLVVGG